jgi:hypothetical protein
MVALSHWQVITNSIEIHLGKDLKKIKLYKAFITYIFVMFFL